MTCTPVPRDCWSFSSAGPLAPGLSPRGAVSSSAASASAPGSLPLGVFVSSLAAGFSAASASAPGPLPRRGLPLPRALSLAGTSAAPGPLAPRGSSACRSLRRLWFWWFGSLEGVEPPPLPSLCLPPGSRSPHGVSGVRARPPAGASLAAGAFCVEFKSVFGCFCLLVFSPPCQRLVLSCPLPSLPLGGSSLPLRAYH